MFFFLSFFRSLWLLFTSFDLNARLQDLNACVKWMQPVWRISCVSVDKKKIHLKFHLNAAVAAAVATSFVLSLANVSLTVLCALWPYSNQSTHIHTAHTLSLHANEPIRNFIESFCSCSFGTTAASLHLILCVCVSACIYDSFSAQFDVNLLLLRLRVLFFRNDFSLSSSSSSFAFTGAP